MRGISWLSDDRLASQEQLCSIYLVTYHDNKTLWHSDISYIYEHTTYTEYLRSYTDDGVQAGYTADVLRDIQVVIDSCSFCLRTKYTTG